MSNLVLLSTFLAQKITADSRRLRWQSLFTQWNLPYGACTKIGTQCVHVSAIWKFTIRLGKKAMHVSRMACTKTRNTGTPEHRNTPEHPGTLRNTGTVEKPRNTDFDGVVLLSHYRPCKK